MATPNDLPKRAPRRRESRPRDPQSRTFARAERRRRRSIVAQLEAVKLLHATAPDGSCAHCGVPAPCPDEQVWRLAASAARAPLHSRLDGAELVDSAIRSLHRTPVDVPKFALPNTKDSQK
ncbi:hypothetical protein [Rhodococcus sp. PD04]|uniref:hypothetical protein n=1 Tax=Rhodococcus sp. PD04 TaxID=3109594 RepID=UPI002DDB2353|nr:hypothetical protein [Rhodococcus sp. PD04]WSE22350.1 hypothetical protein U9J23_22295 [Rhodococcus sp. PD04]